MLQMHNNLNSPQHLGHVLVVRPRVPEQLDLQQYRNERLLPNLWFGRIVASEIGVPTLLVNLVESG